MTQSIVVRSKESDAEKAGNYIADEIMKGLHGERPDALILFASPKVDFSKLLPLLKGRCNPGTMVGCSSAGEFVSGSQGNQSVSAIAIRSQDMEFVAALGRHLKADPKHAASEIVSQFKGAENHKYAYRYALVLTDALAGYADTLVEELTRTTAGAYQLFGGGAGDDAEFRRTQVFFGTEVVSDAAVALEILSNKPFGIGVRRGWEPAGETMRVTEADGARLVSLNAVPAAEVFEEYATATKQVFDRRNPLPFFLHNILGIDTGVGYKLRVPLGVAPDGSVTCAAEIPVGARVHIMRTTEASAAAAASSATKTALEQLNGRTPQVAMFFDCVATRLRLGKAFGFELQALHEALNGAQYAGCNTYGQIARAEGQFSGFHNCTAVVCIIPA